MIYNQLITTNLDQWVGWLIANPTLTGSVYVTEGGYTLFVIGND